MSDPDALHEYHLFTGGTGRLGANLAGPEAPLSNMVVNGEVQTPPDQKILLGDAVLAQTVTPRVVVSQEGLPPASASPILDGELRAEAKNLARFLATLSPDKLRR
jgi:hypothetical protein